MGKQIKSKSTNSFGKGKVTPMQIAFIVDRYLSDNNFSNSRSAFRTEAASLISKSPVQEAPKSLLSLGAILNEYISLKEQKVIVDQERARLEQERFRVQNLLQGMQNVMNVYNSNGDGNAPTPMIQSSATRSVAVISQPSSSAGSPMYSSPNVMPISMPSNVSKEQCSLPSPLTTYPITRKRGFSSVVAQVPPTNKKPRGKLPLKKMPINGPYNLSDNSAANQISQPQIANNLTKTAQPSVSHSRVLNSSAPQGSGSGVAKSLFNKSPNKSTSPTTPTNCTVITSERVTVSPCKNVSYTMERTQCLSSSSPVKTTFNRFSKRENVKGRLDFGGTDVTNSFNTPVIEEISNSESDKEADIFDMDFVNLEAFGATFSELLVDLDLGFEGLDEPVIDTSSGSSHESKDGIPGIDEFSSTLKDVNIEGPSSITAVKSMTKRINLSPSKTHGSS